MLQIKNYEEKKLIMAAFCRENKHIGKEYIWQVWNYWRPEDFPQDDHSTQLRLHDNHVVYEFLEHKNEQPKPVLAVLSNYLLLPLQLYGHIPVCSSNLNP